METKPKNVWKTIGIVFIALFVIETLLISWVVIEGNQSIEKETECAVNICSEADSYYFDYYEEVCYCYQENELYYMEYMNE